MRILMLIDYHVPVFGGLVQDLSAELVARGHEVAVAALWDPGLAEFELDRGVRVYRIRGTVHRLPRNPARDRGLYFSPPFPDPEALWALRRVIARERPDVVHAWNWMMYTFVPLKAWSGAMLVMSVQEYSLSCPKWILMYRGAPCTGPGFIKCLGCAVDYYGPSKGIPIVLGKRAMGLAERTAVDMFIPCSQAVAAGNGLVGSGLPFQVIPNFVRDDVAEVQGDVAPWLAQLPGEDYLLFVGALGHFKGVNVLLRAYEGLANGPPLVLIGYPRPDTPTEFPRNVIILKNWPHHAIMSAWRRSLLALVPSVWPEPFGIVVLEAMATGRPVIGSRGGGIPDMVVDGETGFLVPPGDPVALRQAIERLLADPGLRARMGQAAKRRVVEFQASTVVPRFEQVYRELLEGTAGGRSRAGHSEGARGERSRAGAQRADRV